MGEWMYRSTILDLGTLDGGEWSASRSGRITHGEKPPGIHGIGGGVDLRAGLESVE
jgi:hypothetical protein